MPSQRVQVNAQKPRANMRAHVYIGRGTHAP